MEAEEARVEFFKVVSPAEAMEAVQGFAPLPAEDAPAFEAVGRILAEDVVSPVDLPDFPRATMDGYAIRAADSFGAGESIPAYLDVVGQVPMGEAPSFRVGRGQAARMSTGGMLPEGADAVVMEEYTSRPDERTLEVRRPVSAGENVLAPGDDLRKGERILPAGSRLRSQDIGAFAGVGLTVLKVRRRPRVAILPTGDELVDPRVEPRPGQVRDINRFSLAAAVTEAGGLPATEDILPDDLPTIQARLREAVERADMVLISGGSSMGVRDHTVEAIDSLGEPGVLVHGISIKPGKPTIIGRIRRGGVDKAVVGIPGHPVSALMIFYAFVRPILRQLSGEAASFASEGGKVRARLARNLPSAPGREDLVRVTLERKDGSLIAHPLMGNSAMISTLTRADGFLTIPLEREGLPAGSEVQVTLYG
ncbi:MAG: molybdopterin molybdenumtransferase MoeA [Candidatus Tectomicrobia bacterium]|uniref:Molybdopterin molybdenumtransferase n=1 Tax=Tectimicrobiota bacterium TaxID=2528274 RepID=A0A932ZSD8_UNCTE|nr:molybdopterin molybdenumtransferase MoeA [Candidatus Tectomicrobia bacterium]